MSDEDAPPDPDADDGGVDVDGGVARRENLRLITLDYVLRKGAQSNW